MQKKTKICKKCKKELDFNSFYKNKDGKDGYRNVCKICSRKSQRDYKRNNYKKNPEYYKKAVNKWRKNNPKKVKKTKKNWQLKSDYGITLEQYNEMFQKQQGCCAVCGRHQSELKRALAVDHNHKTGQLRKLLCDRCNVGLGFIEDSEYLKKAIEYLNEFNFI